MIVPMRIWIPAIIGMLMLPACSRPATEPQPPAQPPPSVQIEVPIPEQASAADRSRLAALRDSIAREAGVPRATNQGQCRALPLGSKPCGGPWTYVVYSVAASDSARLTRLAGEFDALQARVNRDLGLASTCEMRLPPDLTLEEGVCMAAR